MMGTMMLRMRIMTDVHWTGEAIEACWGGWSSAQSRELVRSCRNVITNIEEKYGSKNILRITVEEYTSKILLKIVLSN